MMSARFTAVAATSTITSPGPQTGSGTSPQPSTSGPPGSDTVTARMISTLSRHGRGRDPVVRLADAAARRAGAPTLGQTGGRVHPVGPDDGVRLGRSAGTRRGIRGPAFARR